MLVKYLRDCFNRPYACVVGTKDEHGEFRVGYSQCNAKDLFKKTRAREIAYNRALIGTLKQPAKYKVDMNDDGTWMYSDVEIAKAIMAMKGRLAAYYKV
jgi:hypothetical protein